MSTTDRELLELAAKAAGYQPGGSFRRGLLVVVNVGQRDQRTFGFDPLNDDGDALRLAVKLRIDVVFGANYVIVNGDVQTPTVNNANDPYAATRRAITLAAAEIGRQMP